MNRQKTVADIEACGIIAVIRLNNSGNVEKIVRALAEGGVKALEITMTTPNALEVIRQVVDMADPDFIIGAGTVLDSETVRAVILAGAQFIVSPVLKPSVIKTAHRYDKAVFPGAFTPTEILTAWEQGADAVKVFPATALGPGFFKDIRGPLPQIRLTPTGGVSLNNAAEFIRNGAAFLGVGTSLLDKKLIADSDWEGLKNNARAFVEEVRKGRDGNL